MNTQNIQHILIVAGIGIALLAVGGAWFASSDAGSSAAALPSEGALVASVGNGGASPTHWDFGTIAMGDGKVSHEFSLAAVNAPVRIQKIYTSCMCTEASVRLQSGKVMGPFGMTGHQSPWTDIAVPEGETVIVTATFDPAAHGPSGVGLARRSVYLETNAPESPQVELTFEAVVTR